MSLYFRIKTTKELFEDEGFYTIEDRCRKNILLNQIAIMESLKRLEDML